MGNNEADNDWIKLNGCGRITYWRFPETIRCPARVCKISFESISECRKHYQKVHADHMILCPICDKPIDVKVISNIIKHHQRVHAGMKVPYQFMVQSTDEKVYDNKHFLPHLYKLAYLKFLCSHLGGRNESVARK